jgi:coenzyme F420-reducing hydrogenase delta subunit
VNEKEFEPKIVAFLCNWCSYMGANMAGVSRLKYPANIKPVRVMCTGRIDPLFILHAFHRGADGVLVSGCHPGDCHYIKGNLYMRRRLAILRKLLEFVGIEPERLQVSWVSAAEPQKFVDVVSKVVEDVKRLGPLKQLRAETEMQLVSKKKLEIEA